MRVIGPDKRVGGPRGDVSGALIQAADPGRRFGAPSAGIPGPSGLATFAGFSGVHGFSGMV
jgi:hypothetical protein